MESMTERQGAAYKRPTSIAAARHEHDYRAAKAAWEATAGDARVAAWLAMMAAWHALNWDTQAALAGIQPSRAHDKAGR